MGNVVRYFSLASCFLGLLILGACFGMAGAYAAPFAYIANGNSHTVSVIDTATNAVVATVPVGLAEAAIPNQGYGPSLVRSHRLDRLQQIVRWVGDLQEFLCRDLRCASIAFVGQLDSCPLEALSPEFLA